jgi:hypothetical protein
MDFTPQANITNIASKGLLYPKSITAFGLAKSY